MKDNMQQNKCNVQETTSPPQAAKRSCPTITHPLQGTSDRANDEAITQLSPAKKPRTESTKTVCPSIQSNKVSIMRNLLSVCFITCRVNPLLLKCMYSFVALVKRRRHKFVN